MGFEQRIKKLETTLGCRKQLLADEPEIEQTDEEGADWMGDFLWWPKGADMERWPDHFLLNGTRGNGSLGAWQDAARLARQQGHTDYHVGLRPYALAVWLERKPSILKHRRTHGRWIWDEPPRLLSMSREEFALTSNEEKVELLLEQGKGHWSKHPASKK